MKKFVFLIFLINSNIVYTQELIHIIGFGAETIGFENTSEYKYILIDTNNIWFIAKPQKEILFFPPDRPYLGKKAIITDTNDYYSSNIKSYFQFKLFMEWADEYFIDFEHKYDFEMNKDGGIIETSYNNGMSWDNILFDTIIQNRLIETDNLYSLSDTISSMEGQPGFTGLQSSLTNTCIIFQADDNQIYDTILLRFTVSSDSVDNQNEGWMLDYFKFGGIDSDLNKEISQKAPVKIYPNPAGDFLNIVSKKEDIICVNVTNIYGENVINHNKYDGSTIDVTNLIPGIYFLICQDNSNHFWPIKFMKL